MRLCRASLKKEPMSTETTTRVTVVERVTSASSSRNLSVSVERRADADYLIASGIQPAKLGRLVYQLMSEWDARVKPRALTDAEIKRIAEQMPLKRGGRLDMVGARVAERKWQEQQRLEILAKLPAFKKLMDRHAGFLPWVLDKGISDAERKLTDVLLWWCDRKCPCCGGVKLEIVGACDVCHGFGTREVPHDAEGLQISEHIAAKVGDARSETVHMLKQMKGLKKYASGRG